MVFGTVRHRLLYLYGDVVNAEFLVGDSPQATQKRLKFYLITGVDEYVGGERGSIKKWWVELEGV